MTKKQLKSYIMQNSNIDFNYNGKRYGIERIANNDGIYRIFFWEWNNAATSDNSYADFIDFEANAKIEDMSVVEILNNIDDADVF